MLSFSATVKDHNNIDLTWSTAFEKSHLGFILEKSTDQYNWEKLKFIEGDGIDSDQIKNYTLRDRNRTNASFIRYRLRQVDVTGEETLSEIIEVNMQRNDAEINVFPNPVADILFIRNITGQVTIFNTEGKVVLTQKISEDATQPLNLSQLEKGLYYVKAQTKNGNNYTRVISKQ